MTTKRTHLFTNDSTRDSFAHLDSLGRFAFTIEGQDQNGKAARVTITFEDVYEMMSFAKTVTSQVDEAWREKGYRDAVQFGKEHLNY